MVIRLTPSPSSHPRRPGAIPMNSTPGTNPASAVACPAMSPIKATFPGPSARPSSAATSIAGGEGGGSSSGASSRVLRGGGPQIAEARLDRKPLATVRASQRPLDHPPVLQAVGDEDQAEPRPTAGTNQPVRKQDMHGWRRVSRARWQGRVSGRPWIGCTRTESTRRRPGRVIGKGGGPRCGCHGPRP